MNHRMQELYDLADKFAKENRIQSIDAPGNNYFELFHEKFAQLIVKECADKISQEQDIAEQNWQCKNGLHICHELTKHFGVEL